jgi:hypothetical protein
MNSVDRAAPPSIMSVQLYDAPAYSSQAYSHEMAALVYRVEAPTFRSVDGDRVVRRETDKSG